MHKKTTQSKEDSTKTILVFLGAVATVVMAAIDSPAVRLIFVGVLALSTFGWFYMEQDARRESEAGLTQQLLQEQEVAARMTEENEALQDLWSEEMNENKRLQAILDELTDARYNLHLMQIALKTFAAELHETQVEDLSTEALQYWAKLQEDTHAAYQRVAIAELL